MLPLNLPEDLKSPLKILCLGAHSDDIEIGCGGTILHLLSLYSRAEVVWVVFSSGREREREARASAALFLQSAGRKNVIVKTFRDGFFPYEGTKIKEFFEEIKKDTDPDHHFYPLPQRPASGPSHHQRFDLEYLAPTSGAGVRNPKI